MPYDKDGKFTPDYSVIEGKARLKNPSGLKDKALILTVAFVFIILGKVLVGRPYGQCTTFTEVAFGERLWGACVTKMFEFWPYRSEASLKEPIVLRQIYVKFIHSGVKN